MQLGRHISGQFNVELESIRTHVLAMGGLVEEQLSLALHALYKHDSQLATKVKRNDDKVNQMEVAIDEACTRIIAKRQPTAKDLRLVMAIIKTISDLERIGDVATKLSHVAQETFAPKQETLIVSVEAFGRMAVNMLHQVLDAFARMDVQAAATVYRMDDKLDAEHKKVQQQMINFMMQDPSSVPKVMQIVACAQSIERVGDRCQNICEYIIYFVQGKDVRHDKEYLESLI
ncbi:phosphate signaling complex protein PhoU [Vibrio algivorus]|uniref:Phosphate-specific transport system accessory protein PhoU n=1 Tax=Vibrio algivorus TaxID=1667024 RepID=A0A557P6J1_9VIBR|nr:phosphate signaling complex protein PhoU [Vibrio algivorus]TVO36259.1 phosphate signaling complex protein PhoU [Vibrio algivorus]GLT15450.1 phosphate transport system regulatory protein PhoU [Vibrio algivorus]